MAKSINLTPTKIVKEIGKIKLRGTRIDDLWFKYIQNKNGKPNMLAVLILSEIFYWYTPTEKKDEYTGELKEERRKFYADKLQRSFQALGDKFGVSKDQATEACHLLEDLGLITIEYRKINTDNTVLNNVTFMEPVIETIKRISSHYENDYKDTPIPLKRDRVSRKKGRGYPEKKGEGILKKTDTYPEKNGEGIPKKTDTNTLTSTLTSTEDNNNDNVKNFENNLTADEKDFETIDPMPDDFTKSVIHWQNNIVGRPINNSEVTVIQQWIADNKMPFELFLEAIDRMDALNIKPKNIKYVEIIFQNWDKLGIRTLEEAKEEAGEYDERKQRLSQNGTKKRQPEKLPRDAKKIEKYENFYL